MTEVPTRTLPVPVAIAGPNAFACQVRGYEMAGEGIRPGDIVVADPDQPVSDGQLAAVTITIQGRRGRVLRRVRQGGSLLEAASTDQLRYAPIRLGPQHQAVIDGRVVALIRRT
jgi:SOS-response transcriptional repressor LexA